MRRNGTMPRHRPSPVPCPIHQVIELLARPWTLHILYALSTQGAARCGVLRTRVDGISARLLAERLRRLEQSGFVYRHYQQSIPPAVTYGITPRMKDIEKVLTELERLARRWQQEPVAEKKRERAQAGVV